MTIQQLRQFCILAEYENITLASKALFITQPALSMVLKNVEKELGLPLFDRKGRNIYLNHLGKDFYNFAKRTLADYDALLEKFRAPHQDSDALHFCYSSAYIPDYVLPAFSADNPNIPITIDEVEEKMIPHFLQNEIYDIAISSLKCDTGNQRLISANFFRNKLMVSVPFNNPLASHKLLRIEDLSGQKFFRLSKHGEFSDELDALAKAKGVQMNIAQRVNYEIIKKLQKDFDFLYFITTLQAQFDYIPMNRKLIPIEEESLFTKNMYVSYLKNNEEKALQFIDWAKQKLIDFADISLT